MPIITRRGFLRGLITVPILVGAPELLVPRPPLPREPYVRQGSRTVSFIGLALHPAPTFTGSRIVVQVLPWNGEYYPVVLDCGFYGKHRETEIFPDHDLAYHLDPLDDGRQFPGWQDGAWPNWHAWVRFNRFGEHPSVMLARMEAVRRGRPWPAEFSGGVLAAQHASALG